MQGLEDCIIAKSAEMTRQVVYDTKYCIAEIDHDLGIYIQRWRPVSAEMSDDDYQAFYMYALAAVEGITVPQKGLVDLRYFKYLMSPEMQEWHSKTVFNDVYSNGSYCVAVLNTGDFLADMSIEQTYEELELKNGKFIRKYFKDEKKALKWLLAYEF